MKKVVAPPSKAIEQMVKGEEGAEKIGNGYILLEYKTEKIKYIGVNQKTAGIYKIHVKTGEVSGSKTEEKSKNTLIAKAVHAAKGNSSIESKILQENTLQAKQNPIKPPRLLHRYINGPTEWIFMEELPVCDRNSQWNAKEVELLGYALGQFNGIYRGEKLKVINNLNVSYFQKLIQAIKQAGSTVKILMAAGEKGHHKAKKAADGLKVFLNNWLVWQHYLCQQPLVFCHNDPNFTNVKKPSKEGETSAIDWEFAGLAPLGFDPAVTLWSSTSRGIYVQEKELFAGYQKGLEIQKVQPVLSIELLFSIHIVLRAVVFPIFRQQWEYVVKTGQPKNLAMFGSWDDLQACMDILLKHLDKVNSCIPSIPNIQGPKVKTS